MSRSPGRPYSDSFDHLAIAIPSNLQLNLGSPSSGSSSSQQPLSPQHLSFNANAASNTRTAYRHSGLVEAGDYTVHRDAGASMPPPAPASPATSYATARSDIMDVDPVGPSTGLMGQLSFGPGPAFGAPPPPPPQTGQAGVQRQGHHVHRQPSQGSLSAGGSGSHRGTPAVGGSGVGVGRSLSIGGLTTTSSSGAGSTPMRSRRTSSSHRVAYSPNPPSALQDSIWSTPSGSFVPPPPQATGFVPGGPRLSPTPASGQGSPLPPQSGMMRRGTSYDGVYAPPSPTTSRLSLLPTAYSRPPPTASTSSAGRSTYGAGPPPPSSPSRMVGISPTNTYPSSSQPQQSAIPPPASPSAALFYSPNPPSSSTLGSSTVPHHQHSHSHSSVSTDHNRHQSYSPSHYAAQKQSQTVVPPPPPSSSSIYVNTNPSAASFYAHHIPASSQPPPPPLASSVQQPPPPPLSLNYQPPPPSSASSTVNLLGNTPASSSSAAAAAAAAQFYAGGEQLQMRNPSGERENKGFRKVRDVREIKRNVNSQPAGRRADPSGGFISPLKALTTNLPQTYHLVNPSFRYETSLNPRRVLTKPSKPAQNDGFDNEDSDYILYVNDVLGPEEKDRYLILDVLGQGTFGQVVKCQNMKTHEIVAVKVVKNKPAYFQQSMMEVTILELINNQWDKDDAHHMLRLKDTFIHHSHLCLVFELLSNNLYELIKQNSFRGLSTSLVRVFTAQLLDALTVLQEAKIIHCDLKPENILLKSLQSPTIKVIDFGSACHEKQTVYTYIQSRFYRSPEVILSLPYSAGIDMWSLGCICVELFLGLPLFPGTSEYNQITRIIEMLGMPPDHMLENGKQVNNFFETYPEEFTGRRRWRLKSIERYSAEHKTQEQPSKKYFSATTLPEIIKQYPITKRGIKEAEVDKEMNNRIAFIDFVKGLLQIDPEQRWTPQQARMHPFVLGEPLKQPFVPPPVFKNGTTIPKAIGPPSPDPKRYGGLPPTPQRNPNRTFADAKAYNAHLNQQQGYQAQAQQAAQRAAQVPTNPYQLPDVGPSAQAQQNAYGQRVQPPPTTNQIQATMQAQAQIQQQQQQQQAAQAQANATYGQTFYNNNRPPQQQQPPQLSVVPVANPPAVHHYTTRGRSNTLTQQELPPALQKLGQDLGVHQGTGQSITPVLRREDQYQAWELMRNGTGTEGQQGAGPQRRISISQRNPHLSLLQEQAENGLNSWHSPMRPKQGPYPYQSPPQPNQPQFQVVVDSRDRQPDLFGGGAIAPPPQVYSGPANPARYAPYGAGPPPQQSYEPSSPFDGYDHQNNLANLYQPMQPNRQQPPPQLQSSFYTPSVPTNVFPPIPGAVVKPKDLWTR